MITNKGVIIRFNVDSVSQTGRATLGVRLMRMEDGAKVVTMAVVEPEEVEEEIVEVVETTETKQHQKQKNNIKSFANWRNFLLGFQNYFLLLSIN